MGKCLFCYTLYEYFNAIALIQRLFLYYTGKGFPHEIGAVLRVVSYPGAAMSVLLWFPSLALARFIMGRRSCEVDQGYDAACGAAERSAADADRDRLDRLARYRADASVREKKRLSNAAYRAAKTIEPGGDHG